MRLMEVTEKHNFIRTRGSDLAFGIWDSWFEQEMISLEERVDWDREFTHGLNKQKPCSFLRTICQVGYIAFSASLHFI